MQRVIASIVLLEGAYRGNVLITYKSFALYINDLALDAEVGLFVNGHDRGMGIRQNGTDVLFPWIVMPVGEAILTVQQERAGEASQMSLPYFATVNTADNLSIKIPPPVIYYRLPGDPIPARPLPANPETVSFDYPVTIDIRSFSGTKIYYTTNASGISQPSTLFTGPFTVAQTTTIKAKVEYTKLKSFVPLESRVVKRTIRVIR